MSTQAVRIPRIEDEIDKAWTSWLDANPVDSYGASRDAFEAGFRAARTFVQTGAIGVAHG